MAVREIAKRVRTLSERQRQIIVLAASGKTYPVAAAVMKLHHGTVSSMLRRARRKLLNRAGAVERQDLARGRGRKVSPMARPLSR
jgi:DNA-directed RNA polymerase specialized sigma24 family protein